MNGESRDDSIRIARAEATALSDLRKEIAVLRGQVDALEHRIEYLEDRLRDTRLDALHLQARSP